MAAILTIWAYDWVAEMPRGFVRDLRLRWAAEEAGFAYNVRTIPFSERETNHLDSQPFGQVPFLTDGEITVRERCGPAAPSSSQRNIDAARSHW